MLPVWYKAAKPLIDSGEIAMLGVVQEQHAERAQLYKQWKQFDFPIVQDATASLNLQSVPIPLLIDEHGVVRSTRPRPGDLTQFVKKSFEPAEATAAKKADDTAPGKATALIATGNVYLHDIKQRDVEKAIDAFSQAVTADPSSGKAKFSLGVARRMRFDSADAKNGDFLAAAKLWSEALALNPNQYIWRRRIEQYGPRLGKPYPFYDWVDDAIASIKKRGQEPIKLTVNLTGSELAGPARAFASDTDAENPDPQSKITVVDADLVQLNASAVPAAVKPGSVVRLHLSLKAMRGKWNHEAGPLQVWVNESSNGTPEKRLLEFGRENDGATNNVSNVDFEFKTNAASDRPVVDGFVLFHFCDDEGVCFFARKDFKIEIGTIKK